MVTVVVIINTDAVFLPSNSLMDKCMCYEESTVFHGIVMVNLGLVSRGQTSLLARYNAL